MKLLCDYVVLLLVLFGLMCDVVRCMVSEFGV